MMPVISRQRGFTLLEMVLASAMSVFLTLVVVMAYQSNQRSYQYQTAIATMQETARYVSQIMSARLTASDVDLTGGAILSLKGIVGTDTGNLATDSIQVEWDDSADVQGIQYCDTSSQSLPSDQSVYSVFSLDVGLFSGTNSLFCASTTGSAPTTSGKELASEVEHMRILYGVDIDADSSVDAWMDWSNASGYAITQILSIQVGFMLRSENPISLDSTNQVYNLLDIPLTKNDGRLRQIYSFTVALTPQLTVQAAPP